jgi:hypothetical protein
MGGEGGYGRVEEGYGRVEKGCGRGKGGRDWAAEGE